MAKENEDKHTLEKVVNLTTNKNYEGALKLIEENKEKVSFKFMEAEILNHVGSALSANTLKNYGIQEEDIEIKKRFLNEAARRNKKIGRYFEASQIYTQIKNSLSKERMNLKFNEKTKVLMQKLNLEIIEYDSKSKKSLEKTQKIKDDIKLEAKKIINGDFAYDSNAHLFNWGVEQIKLCEEKGLYGFAASISKELYKNLNSKLSGIKNCQELKKQVVLKEARILEKLGLFNEAIASLTRKIPDSKERFDEETRLRKKINMLNKYEINKLVKEKSDIGILEKQESKRTRGKYVSSGEIDIIRKKIKKDLIDQNDGGHLNGEIERRYIRDLGAHPDLNYDLAVHYFEKRGKYFVALKTLREQKNKSPDENEKNKWKEREDELLNMLAELLSKKKHHDGSRRTYRKLGNKEKEEQEAVSLAEINPKKRDPIIQLYRAQKRGPELYAFFKSIEEFDKAAEVCETMLGNNYKARIEMMEAAKHIHNKGKGGKNKYHEAAEIYKNLHRYVEESREDDFRGATITAAEKLEIRLGMQVEKNEKLKLAKKDNSLQEIDYFLEIEAYYNKVWWFRKVANMYQELAKREKSKQKRDKIEEKANKILENEVTKEEKIDLEVSTRISKKIAETIKKKGLVESEEYGYSSFKNLDSPAVHLERINVYSDEKKKFNDQKFSNRCGFKIAEAYLWADAFLSKNKNVNKEILEELGYDIKNLKGKAKGIVKRLGINYQDFLNEMKIENKDSITKYKEGEKYGHKRSIPVITNEYDF